MNPWQALMAQTKPNREEYAVARRVAGVVPRKVKPVISVDEWLRTLPPAESYLRERKG